jgi:hypothetical protein
MDIGKAVQLAELAEQILLVIKELGVLNKPKRRKRRVAEEAPKRRKIKKVAVVEDETDAAEDEDE